MLHIQNKQLISSLTDQKSQMQNILLSRKKILQSGISNSIHQKPDISETYSQQIIGYCAQYERIKPIIKTASENPEKYFKSLGNQGYQFWQQNEKIQHDLQKRLKQLKQIDTYIDDLINEQMQIASQIEDIEDTIRNILGRKQHNHINKAESYYQKKQVLFQKLGTLKKKKQRTKQQKLSEIAKILEILTSMKALRDNRLKGHLKNYSTQNGLNLMGNLANDLEQITKNKKIFQQHKQREAKLYTSVSEYSDNISMLTKTLFQNFDRQVSALREIHQIHKVKSQITFFNQNILNFFGIGQARLFEMGKSLAKFIQNENQKSTQKQQIEQGIETTNETIQIFKNLSINIESQNQRKKELNKRLNQLAQFRQSEIERHELISQKQAFITKSQQHCIRLQKSLQSKAQQADVKGYRAVHSQLQKVSKQIKKDCQELQKLNSLKRQSARRIYSETNDIQEEYKDLLSQILPNIWFRDHDFSKEQTIADLEIYLSKLFSRLRILG